MGLLCNLVQKAQKLATHTDIDELAMEGDEYDDGHGYGHEYAEGYEMQPDYKLFHGVDAEMGTEAGTEAGASEDE